VKTKPVIPREQANRDIDEALAYYLREGTEAATLGFIDCLEQAYSHIARHPATGSLHYAHELNLPSLRFWPLKRYPYLVFSLSTLPTSTFGACSTGNAIFPPSFRKAITHSEGRWTDELANAYGRLK